MTKRISWPEHFVRCATSGQSKRSYCEEHNLSYKSFFYHQHKRSAKKHDNIGAFHEVPVSFPVLEAKMEYHFLDGTHLSFPASALKSVLEVVTTK